MKVKYANVDDMEFSSFAYIICENNGKLYSPVYNKLNRVSYFTDVEMVNTHIVDVYDDIDLKVGDKIIYAYYHDFGVFIHNKRKTKQILLSLILENKLRTPFCILEAIEFIGIKGKRKKDVIMKCHKYLSKRVNTDALEYWEDSISYSKIIGNYKSNSNDIPSNDDTPLELLLDFINKGNALKGLLTPNIPSKKETQYGY